MLRSPMELQAGACPLSPGPCTHHLQVPCGLLDLVTGLGLPTVGAAGGPDSGPPLHTPTFPTSAPRPGTQEQADGPGHRSLQWLLCPLRGPRQPQPKGQSPSRRRPPACSRESYLSERSGTARKALAQKSGGYRDWPTLPGPDLGPDGARGRSWGQS